MTAMRQPTAYGEAARPETVDVNDTAGLQDVVPLKAAEHGGVRVSFAAPLPGFADERDFVLTVINEESLLFTLRSVRNPALRFIVLAPGRFFPDYLPSIHEHDVQPLGLVDNDEVQLFVLVTVRDSIADATANLLAPIVFVPGRNQAMQVILSDASLPLRAPLVPVAS